MTREEEIKEAARAYISGDILSSPSILIHFANGAGWADLHPNLERLWHDAVEEPKGEYKIICLDTLGNVWLTNRKQDMKHHQTGWLECTMCECIVLWAYVKDLLPKGGKK